MAKDFLPINKNDMQKRGWDELDFVVITGDAYVDHPSFGTAIISRVIEAEGFRVGIIAQPNWKTDADFMRFGRPKYSFMINSGNIDSMVAHYTACLLYTSIKQTINSNIERKQHYEKKLDNRKKTNSFSGTCGHSCGGGIPKLAVFKKLEQRRGYRCLCRRSHRRSGACGFR